MSCSAAEDVVDVSEAATAVVTAMKQLSCLFDLPVAPRAATRLVFVMSAPLLVEIYAIDNCLATLPVIMLRSYLVCYALKHIIF